MPGGKRPPRRRGSEQLDLQTFQLALLFRAGRAYQSFDMKRPPLSLSGIPTDGFPSPLGATKTRRHRIRGRHRVLGQIFGHESKRSKTLGDWAVSAGMPGFLAGRELGFREA